MGTNTMRTAASPLLRLTQSLLAGDDPDFRVSASRAESMNIGVKNFAEYFKQVTPRAVKSRR